MLLPFVFIEYFVICFPARLAIRPHTPAPAQDHPHTRIHGLTPGYRHEGGQVLTSSARLRFSSLVTVNVASRDRTWARRSLTSDMALVAWSRLAWDASRRTRRAWDWTSSPQPFPGWTRGGRRPPPQTPLSIRPGNLFSWSLPFTTNGRGCQIIVDNRIIIIRRWLWGR